MAYKKLLSPRLMDVHAPAVTSSWCCTQVKVSKFNHTWTIDNFSFCPMDEVKSNAFSSGTNDKLKWRLRLNSRAWRKNRETKDYLALDLVLDSSDKSVVMAKFRISILNAKGKTAKAINSVTARRFVQGQCQGSDKFIRRDDVLNKANGLLTQDKLTILCEGEVSAVAETVNIVCQQNTIALKSAEEKLSEDFARLFHTLKFSDVTLTAGEQEFQAHKAILASRSSVFAAMFKHEMEERNNNRVAIKDIDPDVLNEMLRFIYTAKVPNLEQMAGDLLAAADKYALEDLKLICEETMIVNLSVENTAEALYLADLHHADRLKALTIDFINIHPKEVMKTVGWKNMIKAQPNLLAEAFPSSLTRKH